MMATLKPQNINFIISDDEFFTEYLVNDVKKFLLKNPYTVQ